MISSVMEKLEMAKNIQNVKKSFPFDMEIVLLCGYPLAMFISKVKAKTYTLPGVQIAKLFPYQMSKRNSHLQMDIFCRFKFCHTRRNSLRLC